MKNESGGCAALPAAICSATGDHAFGRSFGGIFAILAACLNSMFAGATDLSVKVIDRQGRGVEQVVVTVTPLTTTLASRAPKSEVMDQMHLQFVPRVLVVGVGARVEFPNNDTVNHQVYSFSRAKPFQLSLYRGRVHPPVLFDRPGLVVLGCNIHDSMVGYIQVTEAPLFGTTSGDGELELKDIPPGDYRIVLWSPFIADPPASLTRTLHLDGIASSTFGIQLSTPLRAQPEPRPRNPDWEY